MTTDKVIRLTNCRLAIGDHLVEQDLWISATTGRIVDPQRSFFERRTGPSIVHDLGGRIIAPGFIDTQLNGAFGFDFSVPADEPSKYRDSVERVNKQLVKTGVTSYLPTLTSQRAYVYHKVSLGYLLNVFKVKT
jgi:N-acetylglucosamine-6-phosphate deacetylase